MIDKTNFTLGPIKQARKLQATLPIRNYESLTYLLTDGGEV